MKALGRILVVAVAGLFGGGACGSLPDGPTTAPEPERVSTAPPVSGTPGDTPVLGAPASPSPSPSPDPGEEDTGDGGGDDPPPPDPDDGPGEFGCGTPHPPEIARLNVKVHIRGDEYWMLDSTPLVGPDASYCARIGYTDGREFCPVRPDGHPEREGCEAWAVGRARDTGRVGPTWTRNGSACSGRTSGCENAPENQYQARAWLAGVFSACAKNGACGEVVVDK